MDFSYIARIFPALMQGAGTTLLLFALVFPLSLPLGFLITLCANCRFRPVKWIAQAYIFVMRGTPLMLQLLILYYLPGLLGSNIWGGGESGRFLATVVAFVFNYACYFSEIYRGGIRSIPVGQQEAGAVLGMTRAQIFFRVTLLQVVKRIVPPMSNEIITLVKDTSL